MIYMFLSINPSSGDINSSNLSCSFRMKRVEVSHELAFMASRNKHYFSKENISGFSKISVNSFSC